MDKVKVRRLKKDKSIFIGAICVLFFSGITYRLYLLDAPFSSELLSLIRTLSITAVIASFTYHSCLRETFLKEQYSLPSYIILAGAFSWIAFHSIPNWFFPLYCIATTQLIFHSLGNGIRGVEISLLPAIVASTLLFTIGSSEKLVFYIWIPTSITVLCACFCCWYSENRIENTAACLITLLVFSALTVLIMYFRGDLDFFLHNIDLAFFPQLDPLHNGYPALAAREAIRLSIPLGRSKIIAPTVVDYLSLDNSRMEFSHVAAVWGRIPLICFISAFILLIVSGVRICLFKPLYCRWPSVAALAILSINVVFYLLQNFGLILFRIEYVPFFTRCESWNSVYCFLASIILHKEITLPPILKPVPD